MPGRLIRPGANGEAGRQTMTHMAHGNFVMRTAVTCALGASIAGSDTALAAGIKCFNGFQLVQGSYLATPYCQDALVAQVARAYGIRTSAYAIRENPNHKRHVCRLIGRDIRVQESCLTVSPGVRGRGF